MTPAQLLNEVMRCYYEREAGQLQYLLVKHFCRIDGLAMALAAGDDARRAWLEKAIADHIAGRPVPPRP